MFYVEHVGYSTGIIYVEVNLWFFVLKLFGTAPVRPIIWSHLQSTLVFIHFLLTRGIVAHLGNAYIERSFSLINFQKLVSKFCSELELGKDNLDWRFEAGADARKRDNGLAFDCSVELNYSVDTLKDDSMYEAFVEKRTWNRHRSKPYKWCSQFIGRTLQA